MLIFFKIIDIIRFLWTIQKFTTKLTCIVFTIIDSYVRKTILVTHTLTQRSYIEKPLKRLYYRTRITSEAYGVNRLSGAARRKFIDDSDTAGAIDVWCRNDNIELKHQVGLVTYLFEIKIKQIITKN